MLGNVITPDTGWVVSGAVPVLLTLLAAMRKFGGLEQKVNDLAKNLNDQSAAQVKVMEGLVDRLERLNTQFQAHTVQDAQNFGEIKGIMASKVGGN